MGRRKQFRPKKADNQGETEDGSSAPSPPPVLPPSFLVGHPPLAISPWLCDLKGPEGMAARLLQLQRIALTVNNGKVPLDICPPKIPSFPPWPPLWRAPPLHRPTPPKDVFRCVWCTESYPSLEELTAHLNEAKHGSRPPSPPKATPPLPRKLVRGQDVWLGKGQEQTREILKCMWCGQSFKSLAELTTHMQETKHYTKVISQEQITSWKQQQQTTGEEISRPALLSSSTPKTSPPPAKVAPPPTGISDVLTCKVCEEPCSSLKELTAHMTRSNHYNSEPPKKVTPLKRPSPPPPTLKEKRKKSLPVRKLLELERIKSEPKQDGSPPPLTPAGSILGSLEAMVETSFKASCPKKLLSRLGIEEDKSPGEEDPNPQQLHLFHQKQQQQLLYLNNNRLPDDRLSSPSSSSSASPLLPLRCTLCSDELGDKENFADHLERKHAGLLLHHSQYMHHHMTQAVQQGVHKDANAPQHAGGGEGSEESSESKFLKYSELAKQLSGR